MKICPYYFCPVQTHLYFKDFVEKEFWHNWKTLRDWAYTKQSNFLQQKVSEHGF